MSIEVSTVDAPADWACYLINGDASGFDYSNTPSDKAGDRAMAECDAWQEKLVANGGWYVVSTVEDSERFGRWNGLGTDLITYVIHKQVGSETLIP